MTLHNGGDLARMPRDDDAVSEYAEDLTLPRVKKPSSLAIRMEILSWPVGFPEAKEEAVETKASAGVEEQQPAPEDRDGGRQ
jgi:hypothetical protein